MKEAVKKILKYTLPAAFAVALLWFSFRNVEWEEFARVLKACRWDLVLLSMAAGSVAFLLRALRWRRLLLPIDDSITRTTAFNAVNIGNISNFIFPRIGEFIRCGVITRRSQPVVPARPEHKKASYDKVLGTVVLERSWELLVMFLLMVVVVVGGIDRFGGFFVDNILNPMAVKFHLNLWWIAVIAMALIAGTVYLIWRFRKSNRFCAKVASVCKGILKGFASCLKMDKKWLFFAYTGLIWLMYWLMAASTVAAAPFLEGLDMMDALFLSLVGGLGFAVPVPGGIGSFHFIIALALSAVYGVPMELGIVYATLSHTSQAMTQIVFGASSYAYEALKK